MLFLLLVYRIQIIFFLNEIQNIILTIKLYQFNLTLFIKIVIKINLVF